VFVVGSDPFAQILAVVNVASIRDVTTTVGTLRVLVQQKGVRGQPEHFQLILGQSWASVVVAVPNVESDLATLDLWDHESVIQ
jgi:hypothetical protein